MDEVDDTIWPRGFVTCTGALALVLALGISACASSAARRPDTTANHTLRRLQVAVFYDAAFRQHPDALEHLNQSLDRLAAVYRPLGFYLDVHVPRRYPDSLATPFHPRIFDRLAIERAGADLGFLFTGYPEAELGGLASEHHAVAVVRHHRHPNIMARTLIHETGHLFGIPHVNRVPDGYLFDSPPNYMSGDPAIRNRSSRRAPVFVAESRQLLALAQYRDFQSAALPDSLARKRLRILHRIARRYPPDASVYDYIAHTYTRLGQPDSALHALRQELKLLRLALPATRYARSRRLSCYTQMHTLLMEKRAYRLAIQYADSALALSAQRGLWIGKARALMALGDTTQARHAFAEATALAPHTAYLWRIRAQLALQQGDRGPARDYLERAEQAGAATSRLWLVHARLSLTAHDTTAARASLRRIDARTSIDTASTPRFWYDVARLHEQLHHLLRARQLLRRVIRTDTTFARAHAALGYLQLEADSLRAAVRLLRTAEQLDPTIPYVSYNLGAAYTQQGRYAAAQRAFERSRTPDLSHPTVRYNAALTAYLAGHPAAARAHRRALRRMAPTKEKDLASLLARLRQSP